MPYTAADIAGHLQGEVAGDPSTTLTGFASAEGAKTGDLTFAENDYYFTRAEQGAAAAILVPIEFTASSKVRQGESDGGLAREAGGQRVCDRRAGAALAEKGPPSRAALPQCVALAKKIRRSAEGAASEVTPRKSRERKRSSRRHCAKNSGHSGLRQAAR